MLGWFRSRIANEKLKNEFLNTVIEKESKRISEPEKRSAPIRVQKSRVMTSGGQRQSTEENDDVFQNQYLVNDLLPPPYLPDELWAFREQCDTLALCAQILVDNCERLADLDFTGDDKTERDLPQNTAAKRKMLSFFSQVNERHSFVSWRKLMRMDRIITGNAYSEVIRNLAGLPERLYYTPSTYMRVSRLDKEFTKVDVTFPRDGKLITVPVEYRFRRFARINPQTRELTWFKEFGDPRPLDSRTGRYLSRSEAQKSSNLATEIWWFRDYYAGNAYGIPIWISALLDIKGRYTAKWINLIT